MNNNLDLLIINYSTSTLNNSLELFNYVFKHNYTAKILDTSDALIDLDEMIEIINSNTPTAICFNMSAEPLYVMPVVVAISNSITKRIEETTIAYGVGPANLRDVGMKNAKFDFLCDKKETVLSIMNFIGNKDVSCDLRNAWYLENGIYKKE